MQQRRRITCAIAVLLVATVVAVAFGSGLNDSLAKPAVSAISDGSHAQGGTEPDARVAPSDDETDPVPVPEPSELAWRHYRTGVWWWLTRVAWSLVVPAAFVFSGFSARLRDLVQRVGGLFLLLAAHLAIPHLSLGLLISHDSLDVATRDLAGLAGSVVLGLVTALAASSQRVRQTAVAIGRKWFCVVGGYVVLFNLLNFVIDLPLDYFSGFERAHYYGFSNQTLGKWFHDHAISLAVQCVVGVLVVWVPYLLIERSPRRWWLYTSIVAVPFICLSMLVAPIWIAPLFNDFGDMKDKELEAKILRLASRAGIEGTRVFEVNKSEDTKLVNAYVTGFLTTKRIVLWDTAIRELTERELLCVMGHEMGHYVLGHVVQGIVLGSVGTLVMLFVLHWMAGATIRHWGPRIGFDRLGDIASLPLVILLTNVIGLVGEPIGLAISRHMEHEADRFALEITRDNRAAATAFAKMQTQYLDIPRPGLLDKLWRRSHPPDGERIDFCNEYLPWQRGEAMKYERLFH